MNPLLKKTSRLRLPGRFGLFDAHIPGKAKAVPGTVAENTTEENPFRRDFSHPIRLAPALKDSIRPIHWSRRHGLRTLALDWRGGWE